MTADHTRIDGWGIGLWFGFGFGLGLGSDFVRCETQYVTMAHYETCELVIRCCYSIAGEYVYLSNEYRGLFLESSRRWPLYLCFGDRCGDLFLVFITIYFMRYSSCQTQRKRVARHTSFPLTNAFFLCNFAPNWLYNVNFPTPRN